MKGQLLDYSVQTNSGAIAGEDGNRYTFAGDDWRDTGVPQRGAQVDFEPNGRSATAIYAVLVPNTPARAAGGLPYPKSKVTAGLLALFLGGIGIHKFYLGYPGAGIVHIIMTISIIGWFVNAIIVLIEAIIYLTKSDEDFHWTYVENRKSFF